MDAMLNGSAPTWVRLFTRYPKLALKVARELRVVERASEGEFEAWREIYAYRMLELLDTGGHSETSA